MKRIILFCLAVLLLFSPLSLWAQAPQDIKGWNNTTWGMTAEDLRQLFGKQLIEFERRLEGHKLDGVESYKHSQLVGYKIADIDFGVHFEMGIMDNKLRRVVVVDNNNPPSDFSKVENLLTSKYGNPNKRLTDPKKVIELATSWVLPSTKIDLLYYNYSKPSIRGVRSALAIIYTDRSVIKTDTDKPKNGTDKIKDVDKI